MPEVTITSADGTKLAARRSGRGSPLVLVHGATGDLDTFALIERALAERHTVWVYSRRGRGGSSDGADYSLQRATFARDPANPRRSDRTELLLNNSRHSARSVATGRLVG